MNRNWHNTPLQGGSRDAHDYGNSGPVEPMCADYRVAWWEIALGCVSVFAITFALVALAVA